MKISFQLVEIESYLGECKGTIREHIVDFISPKEEDLALIDIWAKKRVKELCPSGCLPRHFYVRKVYQGP